MKNANEEMFSCIEFKNAVSDYIDDELEKHAKEPFLLHADKCNICSMLLDDLSKIRSRMQSFTGVRVSSDFNDKLRARMNREAAEIDSFDRREKPASIFLKPRFILPAAAVILCAALLIPMKDSFLRTGPEFSSAGSIELNADGGNTVPQADTADVIYVMESVHPDKAEVGVFLNEGVRSEEERSSGNILLVSF